MVAAHKACLGNPNSLRGNVIEVGAIMQRVKARLGHFAAHVFAVLGGPVLDHFPSRFERNLIVEQPNPEGRERCDGLFVAHVGAAHFKELLEAHFRENGREVVFPILDSGVCRAAGAGRGRL